MGASHWRRAALLHWTAVVGLDDWRVYEQSIGLPSADTQSARVHTSVPRDWSRGDSQ